MQAGASTEGATEPGAQGAQRRSEDGVAGTSWKVPGAHVVRLRQTVSLVRVAGVAVYWDLALHVVTAAQTRSEVLVRAAVS